MVNYPNDTEVEEDYEIGWKWLEENLETLNKPLKVFMMC